MFKLSFDTDNAAFRSEEGDPVPYEAARILREVADSLDFWTGDTKHQNIRDLNGNPIGTWKFAPEEER
jgi:hypothetical protein